MTDVTVWYLQMQSPHHLNQKTESHGLSIDESKVKQFKVNRFLYQLVGEGWQWHDKLGWTEDQWRDYAEHDNLRTWIAKVDGSIAGYFELKKQQDNVTELAYFGLAPPFVGKGMGGYLLTEAVRQAWQWETTDRVIVNTCSLDHPSALSNYQARGFSIYCEEKVKQ